MGFFDPFLSKVGEKTGEGFGAGIVRVCTDIYDVFKSLLSGWQAGDEKSSWLQKNSRQIATLSILIGVLTLARCSFFPSQSKVSPNSTLSISTKQTTEIKVTGNLLYGTAPKMPDEKDFEPTRKENTQFFFMYDSQKYLMYRMEKNGEIPRVDISTDSSACIMIPKEETIFIATSIPPRYVVNMEETTWIPIQVKDIPSFYKSTLHVFDSGEKIIRYRASWKWVKENWSLVKTKNHLLESRANKNHPGGLVCF